jgi:general secretion pathway protein B
MSFILDALKKSETDRQRQSTPALFEVKVAAPRRRFPLWVAALALLLIVNVVALAWVLMRPDTPARQASAGADSAPPAAVNTTQPGMMTVPATVTIPTTVQIPIGSAPSVTVGGQGDVGTGGPAPLAEEPLLEGHEPAVPPDYDANDYRPALTPAQANAIAAARRDGQVPSRDEILAQGSQLPDLRLDLHVYAVNPTERFVFLNMRKLREGEALPEGVRVEEITPNGVELSYQGKRFALAGN